MCGLAGQVSLRGINPSTLRALGDSLSHRGPDGEGFLLSDGRGMRVDAASERLAAAPGDVVGLAHRRLAVIDLDDRSLQPMLSEDGRLALVYNGEIYNYLELRRTLEGRGRRFRTEGDTEVLLQAYAEWGAGSVERLVGMWAFAMLDLGRQELVLSRDRFGIKPLYYAASDGEVTFASEIKALLSVSGVTTEPDDHAVARYLVSGVTDVGERTFFRDVRAVPPATQIRIALSDARVPPRPSRYWDPAGRAAEAPDDPPARFRELLSESIALHARSDVPVGTCLSGGLDSSAIVCLAERLRREGAVPAYRHTALGYVPSSPELSERRYMDTVAAASGARLVPVEPSPAEMLDGVERVIGQQDEPFASASIAAQWFVFRRAAEEGMTVMLDGQGADETLAGYLGYLPNAVLDLARDGRLLRFARSWRGHRRVYGRPPLSLSAALHAAAPGRLQSAWRGLRPARMAPTEGPSAAARLLAPHLREGEGALAGLDGPPRLDALLRRHTTAENLPALLRYEDRNSMAHSIEARVPFLDHRVVEFAFSLPDEWRTDGVTTKRVLREAVAGVVPEEIRTRRDKVGFRADLGVTARLRDAHAAELAHVADERWFAGDAVAALLKAPLTPDNEFLLWRVMNLKLWARTRVGAPA